VAFDLDTYRRTVTPVRWEDLDLERAFAERPLDEATLRCLRYMHDVESHTVCYLRDLLLTRSHADPDITTFLTMWAYEEYWHGVAIGAVLSAHGEAAEDQRIRPMRERLTSFRDRISPYFSAAGSLLLKEDFVAVHMSWGAINEWSTQTGYHRLVERSGHPVLGELLGRIAGQESRHIAFYGSQARARLAASGRARKATRWALTRLWAPVGSGVMPAAETEFVLRHLMGGPDGRRAAEQIDQRVDRLPGLSGLSLVVGALDKLPARLESLSGGIPSAA
jgi:hypothetical protein